MIQRILFSLMLFVSVSVSAFGQLTITDVGTLPEPVSNNAVCEGFIDGVPHIFSFSGIDASKQSTGIHLKSFKYNVETGESTRIDDLPGIRGKIAAGASRIGEIIYIAGGYHVFQNDFEVSFNTMHRYDVVNDTFLADAARIPVATDDHVQAVWKDSLIYLITGWSNTANIVDVQIFNPTTNAWQAGTSVPNSHVYKSFGSSGTIVADTIYYYGGASSSNGFPIQNRLRKGVINPNNPTEITWSSPSPNLNLKAYRTACVATGKQVNWLGGSAVTYNYDGIAYNGSGGVPPTNQYIYLDPADQVLKSESVSVLPMDLRSLAIVSDTIQYLAGGMLANQTVTDKVFKLQWNTNTVSSRDIFKAEDYIKIFPNPFHNQISIENIDSDLSIHKIVIYQLNGQKIFEKQNDDPRLTIETGQWPAGNYLIEAHLQNSIVVKQIIEKPQ